MVGGSTLKKKPTCEEPLYNLYKPEEAMKMEAAALAQRQGQ